MYPSQFRMLVLVSTALSAVGWNTAAAYCIPIMGEDNVTRMQRCDQEAAIEGSARASAEGARLRKELEGEPPLPSAKNPLLGRWMPQTAGSGAGTDVVGQLAGMFDGAACQNVFGSGSIEFRKDAMISIEAGSEESLGPVTYRRRENTVIVLPEQRLQPAPAWSSRIRTASSSSVGSDSPASLLRVGQIASAAPWRIGRSGCGLRSGRTGGTTLTEKTAYRCANGALIFVADCTYGTPSRAAVLDGPLRPAEGQQHGAGGHGAEGRAGQPGTGLRGRGLSLRSGRISCIQSRRAVGPRRPPATAWATHSVKSA